MIRRGWAAAMANWMNSVSGKAEMKLRVGPALYSVMEPDDEILAGASTCTGPSPWVDVLAPLGFVLVLATFLPPGNLIWHIPVPGVVAEILWCVVTGLTLGSVALTFLRKQLFVAVTRRQVICYRLTKVGEPARLMVAVPRPAESVTCQDRTITVAAPAGKATGTAGKAIRLNASLYWRRELEQVIQALQANGALVQSSSLTGGNGGD